MKKYLVLVKKVSDSDRLEALLNFKEVKFERHGMTMYNVWSERKNLREELNGFDYISCIEIG